ncbi:MAG TPA: hypothetical protein VI434_03335 [Candidatus Dormibacteraeota bacterium]
MTDLPHQPPASGDTAFPPVAELATSSLAVVVIGGILMASSFPQSPDLALPLVLLAISAVLLSTALMLLVRWRQFAWATFRLVARWALLAYVVSAGMIEFSFVRNHASGAPLIVVSAMLVLFAIDVPLIIAVTVARYQEP